MSVAEVLRPSEPMPFPSTPEELRVLHDRNIGTRLLNPSRYASITQDPFDYDSRGRNISLVKVLITDPLKPAEKRFEWRIRDGHHRTHGALEDVTKNPTPEKIGKIKSLFYDNTLGSLKEIDPNWEERQADPYLTQEQLQLILAKENRFQEDVSAERTAAGIFIEAWEASVGSELSKQFNGLLAITYLDAYQQIKQSERPNFSEYVARHKSFFPGNSPKDVTTIKKGLVAMDELISYAETNVEDVTKKAKALLFPEQKDGSLVKDSLGMERRKELLKGLRYLPGIQTKIDAEFPPEFKKQKYDDLGRYLGYKATQIRNGQYADTDPLKGIITAANDPYINYEALRVVIDHERPTFRYGKEHEKGKKKAGKKAYTETYGVPSTRAEVWLESFWEKNDPAQLADAIAKVEETIRNAHAAGVDASSVLKKDKSNNTLDGLQQAARTLQSRINAVRDIDTQPDANRGSTPEKTKTDGSPTPASGETERTTSTMFAKTRKHIETINPKTLTGDEQTEARALYAALGALLSSTEANAADSPTPTSGEKPKKTTDANFFRDTEDFTGEHLTRAAAIIDTAIENEFTGNEQILQGIRANIAIDKDEKDLNNTPLLAQTLSRLAHRFGWNTSSPQFRYLCLRHHRNVLELQQEERSTQERLGQITALNTRADAAREKLPKGDYVDLLEVFFYTEPDDPVYTDAAHYINPENYSNAGVRAVLEKYLKRKNYSSLFSMFVQAYTGEEPDPEPTPDQAPPPREKKLPLPAARDESFLPVQTATGIVFRPPAPIETSVTVTAASALSAEAPSQETKNAPIATTVYPTEQATVSADADTIETQTTRVQGGNEPTAVVTASVASAKTTDALPKELEADSLDANIPIEIPDISFPAPEWIHTEIPPYALTESWFTRTRANGNFPPRDRRIVTEMTFVAARSLINKTKKETEGRKPLSASDVTTIATSVQTRETTGSEAVFQTVSQRFAFAARDLTIGMHHDLFQVMSAEYYLLALKTSASQSEAANDIERAKILRGYEDILEKRLAAFIKTSDNPTIQRPHVKELVQILLLGPLTQKTTDGKTEVAPSRKTALAYLKQTTPSEAILNFVTPFADKDAATKEPPFHFLDLYCKVTGVTNADKITAALPDEPPPSDAPDADAGKLPPVADVPIDYEFKTAEELDSLIKERSKTDVGKTEMITIIHRSATRILGTLAEPAKYNLEARIHNNIYTGPKAEKAIELKLLTTVGAVASSLSWDEGEHLAYLCAASYKNLLKKTLTDRPKRGVSTDGLPELIAAVEGRLTEASASFSATDLRLLTYLATLPLKEGDRRANIITEIRRKKDKFTPPAV